MGSLLGRLAPLDADHGPKPMANLLWHRKSYRWNTLFGDGHAGMVLFDPNQLHQRAELSFDRRY